MRDDPVVVIGPFPPPVHGFSIATQALSSEIAARGPMRKLNISYHARHPLVAKCGNALMALRALSELMRFRLAGGRQVSLGCNGGYGLVFTYTLVLVCRLLRVKCTLHHHSYAYINSKTTLMESLVAISRSGTGVVHVFLGDCMARDFVDRYGSVDAATLPNAYMVSPSAPRQFQGGPLVIGMLSNLSRAKGLDRFIELARSLAAVGVPFRARLAGPIAEEDSTLLEDGLAEINGLEYLGPLYGADKSEFFASLDLFIFPTNYHNEAQPIVIYEAMAHGVPILSVDRGCIAEQIGDSLTALPCIDSFDKDALAIVEGFAGQERERLAAAGARALQKMISDSAKAQLTIGELYG